MGNLLIAGARLLAFVLGTALVLRTLLSAVQTLMLPRSANDRITRIVFLSLRAGFNVATARATTYEARDRIMALYSPVGLLLLPISWLALVALGYTGMFWAAGVHPWFAAFKVSGSSLLTLGLSPVEGLVHTLLVASEAVIGTILIALLIAYLPTMYSAFSAREAAVNMLEVRAGSPPSAVTMIARLHRIGRFNHLNELWVTWEEWFAYVDETHTSLAALAFFRSPQGHRSWVTAAGAVLDAASLFNAIVDVPHDAQADLCIRAGYLALRNVASFFHIPYDPDPASGDPISVSREEFEAAYDELAAGGVPLKSDREQGWRDFAGWRVNYDTVLLELAALTMAPYAPWSSDRSLPRGGRASGSE